MATQDFLLEWEALRDTCRTCKHPRLAHCWVVSTNNNGTQPVHEEWRESTDCGITREDNHDDSWVDGTFRDGDKWVVKFKCPCMKFVPHTLLDFVEVKANELA